MAGKTLIDGASKPLGMAVYAFQVTVAALKAKLGRMIVARILPCFCTRAMTGLAVIGKAREHMTRVGRGAKIIIMAAGALHRGSGEIVAEFVLMTRIAVCRRMDSSEWKTQCGVLLEKIVAILPAFGGVTSLALRSKLTAMNVAVAINTLVIGFRELQVGMAGNAGCLFVSSDERKSSVIVIEPSVALHLRPGIGSMTGLALDCDIAMRITRSAQ